jgi:hypothetical protein
MFRGPLPCWGPDGRLGIRTGRWVLAESGLPPLGDMQHTVAGSGNGTLEWLGWAVRDCLGLVFTRTLLFGRNSAFLALYLRVLIFGSPIFTNWTTPFFDMSFHIQTPPCHAKPNWVILRRAQGLSSIHEHGRQNGYGMAVRRSANSKKDKTLVRQCYMECTPCTHRHRHPPVDFGVRMSDWEGKARRKEDQLAQAQE